MTYELVFETVKNDIKIPFATKEHRDKAYAKVTGADWRNDTIVLDSKIVNLAQVILVEKVDKE